MATSRFPTTHYTSLQFVESAGAILFHLRKRAICLVHLLDRDEWVLAKGRRACGESRQQTALREVTEETGYQCRLLPLTMTTRVTPKIETEHTPDIPRTFTNVSEPIAVTIRVLGEQDAKLIWWYVAAIDEEALIDEERLGEEKFDVALFSYEEAVKMLTFQFDRDTVKMAINLVKETYDGDNSSG
jgi:8-oxo-dGTP pyrophosphatase MutT (NUDIX family)